MPNSPVKSLTRQLRLTRINVALLLAIWFVEQFVGERLWLANLLAYLPQQPLILPTLILLSVSLWKRRPAAAIVNALALAFFVFTLGGFNVPLQNKLQSTLRPDATSLRLRVMTYNILGGRNGIEKLQHTIASQQPDVLCLQEAEHFKTRPDPTPLLAFSLRGYSMARAAEVTTFSRYPIVRQRSYPLQNWTTRRILETTLDVNGQEITVFNVHLTTMRLRVGPPDWKNTALSTNIISSARSRGEQIALLQKVVSQTKNPYLVCGDFNTPPRGVFYRRMASLWNDSFRMAGWGSGHTFRSDWPLLRIDYIWSNPDWHALSSFVVAGQASDHRALVADFGLG